MAALAVASGASACAELDDGGEAVVGADVETVDRQAILSPWLWPLQGTMNRDWVINNYVDLNRDFGPLIDYRGGDRTYDNHAGIDIDLPNFRAMDATVPVRTVTAARVIALDESQPDRNLMGMGSWNYVLMQTADGYQIWYGHLKRNSVVVNVGQDVAAGVVIAAVGSSGNSTQPHLHLETTAPNGVLVEPFQGGFWQSAPAYDAPLSLMDVVVLDAFQARKDFIDPVPNVANFAQGSPLSVAIHTAGGAAGQQARFRVRRPDNSLFADQPIDIGGPLRHGVFFWNWWLDASAPTGAWRVEVDINGVLARTHNFSVVAGRVFFDNFSDNVSDGWTTSGGSWSVIQGDFAISNDGDYHALRQSSTTSGVARARASSVTAFTDQVASARVRLAGNSGSTSTAALLGRYQSNSNYYQGALVLTNGAGSAQIGRTLNGTATTLASVPFPVALNTFYDVRLEAVGTALRLFINGQQVASATDSGIASGSIGVATASMQAEFGQLRSGTPTATTPAPGAASNPTPANGATAVPLPVTLSWTAGAGATSRDVYFGTSATPPLAGNQTGTTFNPGTLAAGTTYFWRIDERAGAQVTAGPTWTFTAATAGGATLFSDDFEANNTAKWSLLSGAWAIATDGTRVMRQTTNTDNARALSSSASWTDQKVSARVKPLSFNGSDRFVAVLARAQDATNYYYATLRSSNKLEIKKLIGGTATTLATKTFTVALNTWYTVRLEVVGTSLKLFVNGTQHLTATDTRFTSGRAGLATFNATASFDDVTVTAP